MAQQRMSRSVAMLLVLTGVLASAVTPSPSALAAQPLSTGAANAGSNPDGSSSGAGTESERLAEELAETLDSSPNHPIVGSPDSRVLIKLMATTLVLQLDPKNPSWRSSSPNWREVSNVVEADIAGDVQAYVVSLPKKFST